MKTPIIMPIGIIIKNEILPGTLYGVMNRYATTGIIKIIITGKYLFPKSVL